MWGLIPSASFSVDCAECCGFIPCGCLNDYDIPDTLTVTLDMARDASGNVITGGTPLEGGCTIWADESITPGCHGFRDPMFCHWDYIPSAYWMPFTCVTRTPITFTITRDIVDGYWKGTYTRTFFDTPNYIIDPSNPCVIQPTPSTHVIGICIKFCFPSGDPTGLAANLGRTEDFITADCKLDGVVGTGCFGIAPCHYPVGYEWGCDPFYVRLDNLAGYGSTSCVPGPGGATQCGVIGCVITE